jgi:RNA polymerase sigma-70 factor (ECF subfamily)
VAVGAAGDANDSDARLAAAAARGDRRSLDRLLERHVDRVYGICLRVLANREDALDATQEALFAISRRINTFDGRSQFTTWVYRVASNAAIDEARRRGRRPRPDEMDRERASTEPPLDAQVADRLDIDAALGSIPIEFRAAVALRDLAGLDYAEIARVLDVPPGTVRSRIARGRAALAERLGNSPPPVERQTERSP